MRVRNPCRSVSAGARASFSQAALAAESDCVCRPSRGKRSAPGRQLAGYFLSLGTTLDFNDRAGRLLRDIDLDDTFVDLKSGFLDNGPILEIRDQRSQVGIRMTALSPQIHAIHVRSAASDDSMIVDFQTNLDDPFSRLWSKDDTAGIAVLQPGQSLQWHVRMEVFPLSANSASAM